MKITNEQIEQLALLQENIKLHKDAIKNFALSIELRALETTYEKIENEILANNTDINMTMIKSFESDRVKCEVKYNYTSKEVVNYKDFVAKELNDDQKHKLVSDYTKITIAPKLNINKLEVK